MEEPKGKNIKLARFTKPECDYLREHCNFTQDELEVFNMKVRDKSTVQISMSLCMAERTVKRRVQSIKRKIYRVL